MEKIDLPSKRQQIYSSSVARPPSPIPTARGSRSAADPILSEYVDKSIQIPELKLPQYGHRLKPDKIGYRSIVLRENDSVRRLVRSIREFGLFQISDHGMDTEELRFALGKSDRIFGLMVGCCTSYGDHKKIVWNGDDRRSMEEVASAISARNYRILRQNIENVSKQLEAIAKELAGVFGQTSRTQFQEQIELGESTISIYRYHRAKIIDPSSYAIEETSQESTSYALSLHLLLESTEICLESGLGNASFETKPGAIVVTIGKDLADWSLGELRSAQGQYILKPFLHTRKRSFSIQQKWSFSNLKIAVGESDKIISVWAQIFIILVVGLLYKFFAYIFS